MEMCSVLCSLGSLWGAPITGAILEGSGGWMGSALFSEITLFLTGVLFLSTRLAQAGMMLMVKV